MIFSGRKNEINPTHIRGTAIMKKITDPGRLLKMIDMNSEIDPGPCIEPEELALLIEGDLDREKKDTMMDHISRCDRCYHAFLITSDIYSGEKRSFLMKIPVRAVAATILVFFFSVYLFYKLNIGTSETIGRSFEKRIVTEKTPIKKKSGHMTEKPGMVPIPAGLPAKESIRKDKNIYGSVNKKKSVTKNKKGELSGLEKKESSAAVFKANNKIYLKNEFKDEEVRMKSRDFKKEVKLQSHICRGAPDQVKSIPEIKKIVHFLNPKGGKKRIVPGNVTVRFELNLDGSVKNLFFINVNTLIEPEIKKSLAQWVFIVREGTALNFRMILRYDSKGKWIINPVNGRKNEQPAD